MIKLILKDVLTTEEVVLGVYDDRFDAELDQSLYEQEYDHDPKLVIELREEDV